MTMTNAPQPPQALIDAAERYFRFRAAAETLKPIMEKITRAVMDEVKPQYDPKWADMARKRGGEILEGAITDPEQLYLMPEEQVEEFYRLVDVARDAYGFRGLQPGHCPYLVCDHLRVIAENDLATEAAKLPMLAGLDKALTAQMALRKQAIDLTLKWVAPFVDKKRAAAIPLPFTYTPQTSKTANL